MGAKNQVIKGAYQGCSVVKEFCMDRVILKRYLEPNIILNKETVSQIEVIDEEMKKSGSSAVLRGALGAAVLGPVGLLAGLSAKNKGVYLLAVEFKDGQTSLIEVDQKIYKLLRLELFDL